MSVRVRGVVGSAACAALLLFAAACGMVDDRSAGEAAGNVPRPTSDPGGASTTVPAAASPGTEQVPTSPAPTTVPRTGELTTDLIDQIYSVDPQDPSGLAEVPSTLLQRIAAKMDRENYYFGIRKRERDEQQRPSQPLSAECIAFGEIRSAGFRLALVTSSDPDLDAYRVAAVDVLDSVVGASGRITADVPAPLLAQLMEVARPGSQVRSQLASARTLAEAEVAFGPIRDNFATYFVAIYALLDPVCARWEP